MKPLVLALDLSTRTGFAIGRDFEMPRHGVWVLPSMSRLGASLSALAGSLEDALATMKPDLVIIESPLPPQAQTHANVARLLLGLAAVAEMICHEQSVPIEEAGAWEARKLVLGKARVSKEAVMAWCHAQNWKPSDDNAGDALLLLRYRHILGRSRIMAGAA